MKWGLVITNPAERGLRRVPRADLSPINRVFEEMCIDPYSGDTKSLHGLEKTYRRRVGDWRILFDVDKARRLLIVLAVKRRGSKTY